jgi:hypothetical protein
MSPSFARRLVALGLCFVWAFDPAHASGQPVPTQERKDQAGEVMLGHAQNVGRLLATMDYCAPESSTAMRVRAMENVQPAGAEVAARFQEKLQAGYDASLKVLRSSREPAAMTRSLCSSSATSSRTANLESTFAMWRVFLSKESTSTREGDDPVAAVVIQQADMVGGLLAGMDYCVPDSSTPVRARAMEVVQPAGAEVAGRFQERMQAGYDFHLNALRRNQQQAMVRQHNCGSVETSRRKASLDTRLKHLQDLSSQSASSALVPPAPGVAPPSDAPKEGAKATSRQQPDGIVISHAESVGRLLAEMDYCAAESSTSMRTRVLGIVQPAGTEVTARFREKLQAGYDTRLKDLRARKNVAVTTRSLCASDRARQREASLEHHFKQLTDLPSRSG